jgi:hypothetical protein
MTLGVDGVLIGNNTQWYTHSGTYQDRQALIKLPSPGVEPNEEVQAGRTVWFSATGAQPLPEQLFEVHSWYSEEQLSEMVDVRAYAEQKMLNLELIYGLDEVNNTLLS